jgi:hypothetical protein
LNCHNHAIQIWEIAEKKGNEFVCLLSRWFIGASSFYKLELEEAKEHFEYVVNRRSKLFIPAVLDSIYALAVTYQMLGEETKADETVAVLKEYAELTKWIKHINFLGSSMRRRLCAIASTGRIIWA